MGGGAIYGSSSQVAAGEGGKTTGEGGVCALGWGERFTFLWNRGGEVKYLFCCYRHACWPSGGSRQPAGDAGFAFSHLGQGEIVFLLNVWCLFMEGGLPFTSRSGFCLKRGVSKGVGMIAAWAGGRGSGG